MPLLTRLVDRHLLDGVAILQVLRLFTARQLEIVVAGEPEFDIAFWKEHTEYKGYRPDDDTVVFFWKVRQDRMPPLWNRRW